MITVTQAFKDAAKATTKQLKAYIEFDGDQITESDDLQSLKIISEGSICKSIMRQAEAVYFGDHDYLGQYVSLGYGVVLPEIIDKGTFTVTIADPAIVTKTTHGLVTGDKVKLSTSGALPTGLTANTFYWVIAINANTFNLATSYSNALNEIKIVTTGSQSGVHNLYHYPSGEYDVPEYIDYGEFYVKSLEVNQGTSGSKLIMFDKMYEALQKYDLEEIYDIVYPCTLLELVEAICTRLDWTLGSMSFPNDDLIITEDLFSNLDISYRNLLDDVAEASGSIIYFDVDNTLKFRQPSDTVLETLTSSDLMSLKVESEYGPVNSVVLSRQPQEDNIVQKDDVSIAANGLTELKISNNVILDPDREAYIGPIFDALETLAYHPFKATTVGLGYFQIGDRIIVENPEETPYEVIISENTINITTGITESISTKVPEISSTNYDYAGIINQAIRNTQIIVDKQNGVIILLNSSVTEIESLVTTLTQTIEDIQIQVEGIGGTNLLKNSVGLKGDIKDWQILDEDGDPVDPDNDGTIVQTTDVKTNTESGSAIQIDAQYITQTFPTIVGETYTFYCRFNRDGDTNINITGIGDIALDVTSYTLSTWAPFSCQFVAGGTNTTLIIETTGVNTCLISDAVVKLGDANGWVQAPNEVYGANYKFDKDGFEVSSLTNSIKAVLDNTSLSVIDTSGGGEKIMMEVSQDSGKISNLVAQDRLTIQRYENPDAAAQFIPTADGVMLIINN